MELSEIKQGARLVGLRSDGAVEVLSVESSGGDVANVVFRSASGELGQRLVSVDDAAELAVASEQRWSFDADGEHFRLASEARRIELAHLFDPFTAVEAAGIDPLPHQIEAVYERLLPMQPLRFLLADDPGAGKTIMAGLYIRELVLRGDLARCLIVAPGSLVEQWQEELWDKFNLSFDILSRDMVEASRTGNPFLERNLLIARVDQIARNDDLLAKLSIAEWDLVVVDEAHKMSAHLYGNEVDKTKRFQLGERLRDQTRNFLLMTATPHNGKNEDFLLFMSLLDPERFAGRLRKNAKMPDVSDVMRRYVKENLLTFDGKRLFTERKATTVNYDLSPGEQHLYDEVTNYVRTGMNRAQALEEGGDRRRGLVVGFALAGLQRRLASSPAAIHESLRRRRQKLETQVSELEGLANGDEPIPVADLPKGLKLSDLEDFDFDDYDDEELENLENAVIDGATAAATVVELDKELVELRELERIAADVRASREDRKWNELATILQSDTFTSGENPRKLIIFTEHKDTLTYLTERIESLLGRPEAVVTIHGGVRREDRRRVQDGFRNDPTVQVLVATDAAGEGVNLQRANLMVNYDIPWNPNRIEQRFGRIHRIGQKQTCFLWNLVAHGTREGKVFERLFQKIEQQRQVYGDQVYDVLGDAQINRSLQDLLINAIRYGEDPKVVARMEEVVDAEIGTQLEEVLAERALATEVLEDGGLGAIRDQMELARARKLQPGFVAAFFDAALGHVGGRAARREAGRFEVTRVPAAVRSREREAKAQGPVHDRYERITFDKDLVVGADDKPRAELVAPGHPLLAALIDTILEAHGDTLNVGATLVDEADDGVTPRVLIYLDHAITDGRFDAAGRRQAVSRRFHFVEVDQSGDVHDPGADPYLNYRPLEDDESTLIATNIDHTWADAGVDGVARNWAIANLATPHFADIAEITKARIDKVRQAVEERLDSEIRYWDARAAELKQQELHGKKPRLNSGRARQRADDLETRKQRRMRELAAEADLVNQPPNVVAAALVIPKGLIDALAGVVDPMTPGDTTESDRRAVAAVKKAEEALGRIPEEQHHNNPGFDILSLDPETGTRYFIEVKGHKPTTKEIKVSAVQVRQGKQNPERFRLAVVEVPDDPDGEPAVSYFVRPFDGFDLHFAQTYLPMKVADLIPQAVEPQ